MIKRKAGTAEQFSHRHYKLFCLFILLVFSSCLTPVRQYSKYIPPPQPEYSNEAAWAALPEIKDSADAIVPGSGFTDGQDSAIADVFYIHPTLDFSGRGWNADVRNRKINKRVDKFPIRFQASVFNGSCKIYAPRYRQATLYSFTKSSKENGEKALRLAYEDVRRAFQYYMDHYNQGRPVIIASHSQGSYHAYRLLEEFFNQNITLRKQLVAAYVIGMCSDTVLENIPRCDSSSQTGCIISWNTYKWGANSSNKFLGSNYYCVNPLSWKTDSVYCPADINAGGLPRSFKRIDPNICDAKIHNGLLWIHKPSKHGYFKLGKNYHVSDYNLFYKNLRDNIRDRLKAYLINKN